MRTVVISRASTGCEPLANGRTATAACQRAGGRFPKGQAPLASAGTKEPVTMSRRRAVRTGFMPLASALLVAIAPASADLLYFDGGGEAQFRRDRRGGRSGRHPRRLDPVSDRGLSSHRSRPLAGVRVARASRTGRGRRCLGPIPGGLVGHRARNDPRRDCHASISP
jgi:hypothetical protein